MDGEVRQTVTELQPLRLREFAHQLRHAVLQRAYALGTRVCARYWEQCRLSQLNVSGNHGGKSCWRSHYVGVKKRDYRLDRRHLLLWRQVAGETKFDAR